VSFLKAEKTAWEGMGEGCGKFIFYCTFFNFHFSFEWELCKTEWEMQNTNSRWVSPYTMKNELKNENCKTKNEK